MYSLRGLEAECAVGFAHGVGTGPEEGFFFVVEGVIDDFLPAGAAQNHGYAYADVVLAIFTFEVYAARYHFFLVFDDGLGHVGGSGSGSIPGRGAQHLGEGGTAHHGIGYYLVERGLVEQLGDGNTLVGGKAHQRYHGGIAVSADDDALYFVGVGVECFAQVTFEARAVEGSAHTDDTVLGEDGRFLYEVGHRVHGVAYAHDDGVGRVGQHILGNTLDDACVDTDELFAGHARLAGYARGDDDDVGAGRLGVVVGYAAYFGVESEQCGRLSHVEGFAFGHALFDVEQYDFTCHFVERQNIGAGCAYISGAYYGNFCHDFSIKGVIQSFLRCCKAMFLHHDKGKMNFFCGKISVIKIR